MDNGQRDLLDQKINKFVDYVTQAEQRIQKLVFQDLLQKDDPRRLTKNNLSNQPVGDLVACTFTNAPLPSIFADMSANVQSSRLERNNIPRPPTEELIVCNKYPFRGDNSSARNNAPDTSTARASINEQFFVWKNGVAGRMTVDTPFGFKET